MQIFLNNNVTNIISVALLIVGPLIERAAAKDPSQKTRISNLVSSTRLSSKTDQGRRAEAVHANGNVFRYKSSFSTSRFTDHLADLETKESAGHPTLFLGTGSTLDQFWNADFWHTPVMKYVAERFGTDIWPCDRSRSEMEILLQKDYNNEPLIQRYERGLRFESTRQEPEVIVGKVQ